VMLPLVSGRSDEATYQYHNDATKEFLAQEKHPWNLSE
jgi:hypothetical protein